MGPNVQPAWKVPQEVYSELEAQFRLYAAGGTVEQGAIARGKVFIDVDVIQNPKIMWGGWHKKELMQFTAYIGAQAVAEARMAGTNVDYRAVDKAIEFLIPSWEARCTLPPKVGHGEHPRGDCQPTRDLLGMPPAKEVLARKEAERLALLEAEPAGR